MSDTLGMLNPLRYRGYVYDQETKLYYLQSRYYNPDTGRFLNPDAFTSTGQGLLGNNMFAYCNNSPITNLDSNGTWTIGLFFGANATCFFGVSIGIGFVLDGEGNAEWQWTYSIPFVDDTVTIGLLNVGGGATVQWTSSETVTDLHGATTNIGGTIGAPWYVGGDIISFSDASNMTDSSIDGFQLTGGFGLGYDLHISETYTQKVSPRKTRKETAKGKKRVVTMYDILTFKERRLTR